MLQQWARRYEKVANPRYHLQKRARIRAFYRDGVEKWQIPRAVETLPVLLHISLFLFFAGLSVFLFGVHRTIFKTVTALIGACVISYACLSVFPIIHKNSLYSTPLSLPFSFCLTGIRYLFFLVLFRLLPRIFPRIGILQNIRMLLRSRHPGEVHLYDFFSRSMAKTAERYAVRMKPDIDHKSLLWTFKSIDEDADFEEFFEGLPRLCDSDTGEKLELKENFIKLNKEKLSNALIGLMDRTLISNLVKEFVKHRRMIIFTKVVESKATPLLDPLLVLRRVLFENWHGFLECIEFGLSMQNWTITSNDDAPVTFFYGRCVAALIISIIPNRDKRWIQLATINVEPLPRSLHHKEDHHSILLATAIYIVRMSVETYSGSKETHRHEILDASRKTLGAVCKLDIGQTLSELRHEFCDLWNKLVRTAQTDQLPHHRSVSMKMLKNIRKLYIALHSTSRTDFNTTDDWEQILDNPSFYPECTDDGHRPSLLFPDLQFNTPPNRSPPSASTRSPSGATTPSGVQFPEPYLPTPPIPSPASPDQPPPSFPVAEPYVHPEITENVRGPCESMSRVVNSYLCCDLL